MWRGSPAGLQAEEPARQNDFPPLPRSVTASMRVLHNLHTFVALLMFGTVLESILGGCSLTPPQSAVSPAQDANAIGARECKQPAYPPEAKRQGVQGVSKIRFHINANGDAIGAEVLHSSGSRRLDQATIDALSRCKWAPALKDGQAVEGYRDIDYTWRLE